MVTAVGQARAGVFGKGEAVSWGCEGGEHGPRPSQSGSHT